ncbi:MAG: hypothetical protein AABY11_01855, partial [archaeon]
LEMHFIPRQRKLYYHCVKFKSATPSFVMKTARDLIAKDLSSPHALLPLYRLKFKGSLAKGYSQADVDMHRILEGFVDKAIFSTSKKFDSEHFSVRLDELRALHKSNASLAQMGLSLLEKNMEQTPFSSRLDAKRLFALLEDKENVEQAIRLLEKDEILSPPSLQVEETVSVSISRKTV